MTAWDITTESAVDAFNPLLADMLNVLGIWVAEDGTRMFLSGTGGSAGFPRIVAYTLGTPWEIDNPPSGDAPARQGHVNTDSFSTPITSPQDLCVKPDGTRIIVSQGATQYQLDMSTPWDVTTLTYNGVSSLTNAQQTQAFVTPDGQYMYLFRTTGSPGFVMQYPMSTPWDLATLQASNSFLDVSAKSTVGTGLYVTPEHLLFLGATDFFQYDA